MFSYGSDRVARVDGRASALWRLIQSSMRFSFSRSETRRRSTTRVARLPHAPPRHSARRDGATPIRVERWRPRRARSPSRCAPLRARVTRRRILPGSPRVSRAAVAVVGGSPRCRGRAPRWAAPPDAAAGRGPGFRREAEAQVAAATPLAAAALPEAASARADPPGTPPAGGDPSPATPPLAAPPAVRRARGSTPARAAPAPGNAPPPPPSLPARPSASWTSPRAPVAAVAPEALPDPSSPTSPPRPGPRQPPAASASTSASKTSRPVARRIDS